MSPSSIDIGGLRIAVSQNREHGPPIVFVQGNSVSASTCKHQLIGSLVRLFFSKALMFAKSLNEFEIIENRNIHYVFFQGVENQLVSGNYFKLIPPELLWKNGIHSVENAGHLAQMESSTAFNNLR